MTHHNSCDSESILHRKPTCTCILTQKQPNPSWFGNKSYKLTVLLLFNAEADVQCMEQLMQDTKAIIKFPII